jgi:hypothetical protein
LIDGSIFWHIEPLFLELFGLEASYFWLWALSFGGGHYFSFELEMGVEIIADDMLLKVVELGYFRSAFPPGEHRKT